MTSSCDRRVKPSCNRHACFALEAHFGVKTAYAFAATCVASHLDAAMTPRRVMSWVRRCAAECPASTFDLRRFLFEPNTRDKVGRHRRSGAPSQRSNGRAAKRPTHLELRQHRLKKTPNILRNGVIEEGLFSSGNSGRFVAKSPRR